MCSFLLFFNCHMEPAYRQAGPQMIIGAGSTPVRGDFMCSFFVRSLKPAFFICHMECPMIIGAG